MRHCRYLTWKMKVKLVAAIKCLKDLLVESKIDLFCVASRSVLEVTEDRSSLTQRNFLIIRIIKK